MRMSGALELDDGKAASADGKIDRSGQGGR